MRMAGTISTLLAWTPSGTQWWAWIFEYLNKMASNIIRIRICAISPVQKYSDIRLSIFGRLNTFGYLFVNSWKSEYIRIFAPYLILLFACLRPVESGKWRECHSQKCLDRAKKFQHNNNKTKRKYIYFRRFWDICENSQLCENVAGKNHNK